jgi:DNA repair protein RecO (recombination protein O)
MVLHQSEAIVLRTWPFQESDLLVSLFTRDMGRVRGVARAALKSRRRFGGALEPMTWVRATYAERPRQELVRMDQFELLASPLAQPVDHLRAAALAFYTELLDNVLPDHDPQDAIFRLTLATVEHTRVDACWPPLTYFSLWMTRLLGWLPALDHCTACDVALAGAAYFHPLSDGLCCVDHRGPNSSLLSRESLLLAQKMLRAPLAAFIGTPWPSQRAQDLRRFTMRTLERHLEQRLNAAAVLVRLGG